MTELLITYAQFLGASALLVAFYWLVLRHRASYKLSRLYLIGVPMLSAMMCGLKFEIEVPAMPFLTETEAMTSKITPALIINEPQYNSITETVSAPESSSAIEVPMIKEPQAEKSQVNIDYAAIIRIIVPLISVILLLIAAFHIIKLLCIKQKLPAETTAEGYELIHSSAVQTPFSFGKTIFLPEGLDADRESYIVCHEKAHITHGHYIDVWIAEILARMFWFNPFVWYCRSELSNIHEFEADHDVIVSGADILAYQTTLLEMVMNESSPVVSGFNHSFIRQRFIEMKKSTVNTLGRMGKFGTAAWVVALICLFTISFKPVKANTVPELKDPQLFTIIGHVDENITDSCYNIYLSDEYFHIDGDKPVACVPVVNKQFRYEIPLTKTLAGRLRCIFPGGELCESWIDLFFVPGTTVDLTVHNGNYTLLYPDDNYENYDNRLRRAIYATRKATNWESPHIEKIDGQRWVKPEQSCQNGYMGLHVQEVIFNDKETVLRLVTDFNTGNLSFSSRSYLTDEQGNQYKLLRAISGSELDENCSKQVHVFGGLYAFEPLPKGIKTFSFFNGPDGVRNVTHITEAKPTDETPNFKLNITATPGIGDSGYLINCRNKWGSYEQLDDIALDDNRQCSFSIHLDSLLEGVVQAIFPDGSVCRYVMTFPFIPGETAELTVKNGVFSLTGTNFYKRWHDADELFENAKRFHTPEEARMIVIDYIKEHSSDEACFRYFQKEYLPCQELVTLASESLLATDYGQQLKRVAAHEAKVMREANEPLVILFKKTNEDMYSAEIIDLEEYEAYLANPIPGDVIFRYKPGDPDIPFSWADHPRVINNGLIQIQPKDWPRAERFMPQEPTTKNGQRSTEPQEAGWSKATVVRTNGADPLYLVDDVDKKP